MSTYAIKVNNSNSSYEKYYFLHSESEFKLDQNILNIFYDHLFENIQIYQDQIFFDQNCALKTYKLGTTDNQAQVAGEALGFFDLPKIQVMTGESLVFFDQVKSATDLNCIPSGWHNPLIHKVRYFNKDYLQIQDEFNLQQVLVNKTLQVVPLLQTPEVLFTLNNERGLALNHEEIKCITEHYQKLNKNPSLVEIEIIAQSWSEHCKHKIFASHVDYTEDTRHNFKKIPSQKINNLFKTFIKNTTKKLNHQNLVSVFSDNAGIVRLDDNIDLCLKVETHNTPSALEPYGGALTGILGVNRDILGTGLGAKPIANMDVLCFCPNEDYKKLNLPQGTALDPQVILRGVHKGIEDGGNQSGIPTVNGSLYFDASFVAKPLVYVGTLGVLPQKIGDRFTFEKKAHLDDFIYVVGGKLGKDGIHGATYSSMQNDSRIPASIVQIGDSFTQKRVLDFILKARDLNYIQAITDNGAGGISCSVGEIAQLTGGAEIDISKHPLKYLDLEFEEMLISESQERMTVIVRPENSEQFEILATQMNVSFGKLGKLTNSGKFTVYYQEQLLADLDLNFLHQQCPQLQLKAYFDPSQIQNYQPLLDLQKNKSMYLTFYDAVLKLLQSANITSKESWVRCFDQDVQSAVLTASFNKKNQIGPSDAAVIDLHRYGGSTHNFAVLGHGFCPRYSRQDTYKMTLMAVDECLRNLVASGADPDNVFILDNYCWPDPQAPNPNAEHRAAELVRSLIALQEISLEFGVSIISGKDSMKNNLSFDQNGKKQVIEVLPSLLITGVSCARKIMTTEFKNAGDLIYTIGSRLSDLSCSEFAEYFDIKDLTQNHVEYPDILNLKSRYQKIHTLINQGIIKSCHDISEGGLIISLCECLFGTNKLGAQINHYLPELDYFKEGVGSFVISVSSQDQKIFEACFDDATLIGEVTESECLLIQGQKSMDIQTLKKAWQKGIL